MSGLLTDEWMPVGVEILDLQLHPIRNREDTILLYKAQAPLTVVSLLF